jgi:hypothetical protein
LLLNYHPLPPLRLSYHRMATWKSYADSINLEIKVFDLEKNVIPGINVVYHLEEGEPEEIYLYDSEAKLNSSKSPNCI